MSTNRGEGHEVSELGDVERQRSDFASSIAGVGNKTAQNPDLDACQCDIRRLVGRRPCHHRQLQDPPAQDAERGHQVGETVERQFARISIREQRASDRRTRRALRHDAAP